MDEKIAQFSSVAGVNADRAKFFVESANGDLDAALATFYESQETAGGESEALQESPSGPRTLSGASAEPIPASWGRSTEASGSAPPPADTGRARGERIATLGSLKRDSGGTSARGGGGAFRGGIGRIHQGGDDDDDEGGPPNLFTGGERSALSVQDPEAERRRRMLQAMAAAGGPGGEGGMDMVQNILRQAAEAGAPPPSAAGPGPVAASGSLAAFGGRGRTIDDDGGEAPASGPRSAQVDDAGDEEDEEDDEDGSNLPVAVRNLIFWQDGFTIGDSDLYTYDDPENHRILSALQSQRAPLSLMNVKPNQEVELRVQKRLDEKYVPPPAAPHKVFGGSGNRLGSPAPAAASSSSAAAVAAASSSSSSSAGPSRAANPPPASQIAFEIDSSKPTTQLQIRLADGSRLVTRFNHHHTLADVRGFINASRPGAADRAYVLQTSFPPKPIENEQQTLAEAGLLNAVVIQKWT